MEPSIPPLAGEAHVCTSCEVSYADIGVATALDRIRVLPAEIAAATLPVPEATLRRRPDETTWSVLEYVCHVRDVYSVFTIRLYRTRTETSPVLEPMFNDLRATRLRYNRRDLGPVLSELSDNCLGVLDEAARFEDHEWDGVATRLPGEQRSARWMVRQAMHEGIHHLGDLGDVLRRLESQAGLKPAQLALHHDERCDGS